MQTNLDFYTLKPILEKNLYWRKMKRIIDCFLSEWKDRLDRKPLLLRGARQVGKTHSMRELGKARKSG